MGGQLEILSQKEIKRIYGLPKLTVEQRAVFLELTLSEQETVRSFRTTLTRVYFILQLAYFKFSHQFFVFELDEVSDDVAYLQNSYFLDTSIPVTGLISKPRRLAQQKAILKLTGYVSSDQNSRRLLFDRACRLATLSAQPVFIFRDLMNWAEQKKVVLPGYSVMQRAIIGKALTLERKRLESLAMQHLSEKHRRKIDRLIQKKAGHFYTLTELEQEAPNFKPQSLREEVERKEILKPLFFPAESLTDKLGISNENIRYYASLAGHYTVGELRQFKGGMIYVFLACYIRYRYRQINDVLTEAFKYYIRKYDAQAKRLVKDYFYKYHLDANEQLNKVPEILAFFINDSIDPQTPFSVVKQMVLDMLGEEKILLLSDFLKNNRTDEITVRWQHYEDFQRQISYNLRHLFIHLDFSLTGSENKISSSVTEAADIFKQQFLKKKPIKNLNWEELPKKFIPKYLQQHLFLNGNFIVSRYELMLYQALGRQMEAGHIFIRDSFQNQSLEADLIALSYWKKNDLEILNQIDLPKLLQTPQALLSNLETVLEKKIKTVNLSVQKGKNRDILIKNKATERQKWHLPYVGKEAPTAHQIYKQMPLTDILPILKWADQKTTFTDAFKHVLNTGTSKKADEISLFASIIALGTNHGLPDMAGRSDTDYNQLKRTTDNFIRPQTLRQASKIIVDATSELPMFSHYNIARNTLHSSSDGQKFSTRFDTINARYSPKYFGLGKGVSLNTLVLNHIPVNAKIIGANEHESHFVFDLLFNNPTEIQPTIHSTDTHGSNKINFAILDFFGYRFAPRYKNFPKETTKLVGFKKPGKYPSDYLIKPIRQINKKRFIEQWDNIKRIMASLALKTTSQSIIVKKLSSYNRVNDLQAALADYNDIVKSIFLLDYLHDRSFRQNIQTALNRGEGFHRLRKNVAYAHDGKLQVHTRHEQLIWSECTRLICNVIIYYNTFLLSQLLEKYVKENDAKGIEIIQNVSPVAWQHINLQGYYLFNKTPQIIDWKQMIQNVKFK